MNLKEFAVHRKLNKARDELLNYVISGDPVPIDVLEKSFSGVLSPLKDDLAETLITDYMGALNKTVPLIVTVLPSGGYDISGEIPDNMMEAIELVHNLKEDHVVREIVNHQLTAVYKKEACDIVDMDISKEEPIEDEIDELFDEPIAEMFDEPIEEEIEEPVEEVVEESVGEVAEEPIKEFEEPVAKQVEESVKEPVAKQVEEPVEEPVKEPVAEEKEVIEPLSEPEEEEVREPPVEDSEIEKQKQVTEAIRRIYNRFCEDLIAYRLDERLNLNI
jgi:uncharacterized membrane-anchored protein YjiN (DUF445 family)